MLTAQESHELKAALNKVIRTQNLRDGLMHMRAKEILIENAERDRIRAWNDLQAVVARVSV